jgi:hypothetical protein
MKVRWSALACAVGVSLVCCSSGSGSTPHQGPGGDGTGYAECVKYQTWPALGSSCVSCLHERCAAPYQVVNSVCAQDPNDACQKSCGTDTACFCECMVRQPGGCGSSVGAAYACFVNSCAAECASEAGAGGAAGSGGTGGAGGKAGSDAGDASPDSDGGAGKDVTIG